MDSTRSELTPLAGFCEHGNETFEFHKSQEIFRSGECHYYIEFMLDTQPTERESNM
jgi:hypothetical protein